MSLYYLWAMDNLYQEKWTHMLSLFRLFLYFYTILRLSVHHKLQNKEPSQIYSRKFDEFRRSIYSKGFTYGSSGKESARNVGDLGSIPRLGRSLWGRERLPTPVFWPREFQGLYSPWSLKELDTTEGLSLTYLLIPNLIPDMYVCTCVYMFVGVSHERTPPMFWNFRAECPFKYSWVSEPSWIHIPWQWKECLCRLGRLNVNVGERKRASLKFS